MYFVVRNVSHTAKQRKVEAVYDVVDGGKTHSPCLCGWGVLLWGCRRRCPQSCPTGTHLLGEAPTQASHHPLRSTAMHPLCRPQHQRKEALFIHEFIGGVRCAAHLAQASGNGCIILFTFTTCATWNNSESFLAKRAVRNFHWWRLHLLVSTGFPWSFLLFRQSCPELKDLPRSICYSHRWSIRQDRHISTGTTFLYHRDFK